MRLAQQFDRIQESPRDTLGDTLGPTVSDVQVIPASLRELKVAIVHYWFLSGLGGERVTRLLAQMFPHADIFTLLANDEAMPADLKTHRIITSYLQHLPGAQRLHRHLMPLYPSALEQFDLGGYDLVISAESGPSKGVITGPSTCHICFCHTPPRYVWDMYHQYRDEPGLGMFQRFVFSVGAHYFRMWDLAAAQRVDHYVAISSYVAGRIRKYYQRDSTVIYPPLNVGGYISETTEDYYLVVSRLVGYKRVDLAIEACNRLGRRLRVVGEGEQYSYLKRKAGRTVEFLGFLPSEQLRNEFAHCRALLFPGEEDLGATPVEAHSFGRPVIAYGRGGALETVVGYHGDEGQGPEISTGMFFSEQTADSLADTIVRFEAVEKKFSPKFIRSSVLRFDFPRFKNQMYDFIEQCLEEHRGRGGPNEDRKSVRQFAVD